MLDEDYGFYLYMMWSCVIFVVVEVVLCILGLDELLCCYGIVCSYMMCYGVGLLLIFDVVLNVLNVLFELYNVDDGW